MDLLQNLISSISDDVWVILIAILVGLSCSLVGVFLVLRRMSMLGDAISHSVLFGIVMGFLVTGSRDPFIMIVSAALVGLLTAFLTSFLNSQGRLQEDASIGVTFTWLFALGVILISAFAGSVDLDQECVLYGEIAFAAFDRWIFQGVDLGPRSFWLLLLVTSGTGIFVACSFRRLKLLCFDRTLAHSLGISVTFWHYTLMAFVSMVTVAAFDAVGAILVVALLVTPANSAFLLAKSVLGMLLLALGFAVLSALGGYFLAAQVDASISAAIALISGLIFIVVLLGQKVLAALHVKALTGRQQNALQ